MRTLGSLRRAQDRLTDRLGLHWFPMAVAMPMLLVVPLLVIFTVYMTFVQGLPTEPGFTLRHWGNIARSYVVFTVIPNTAIVALGSVGISLIFGITLSWFANCTCLPSKNLFVTMMGLVIVVPGFVRAIAWHMLINPTSGMFNNALRGLGLNGLSSMTVDSLYGMAWVLGLTLAPAIFFLISGPLSSLNSDLNEAAAVGRARGWRIFWSINLPLVWPAILGAAIYAFITAIAIFEVPAMLGGGGGQLSVLATELFYTVQPTTPVPRIDYGAAGVYASLIMLPSLVGVYFYLRALGKANRYAIVTGRGYRSRQLDSSFLRYAGTALMLVYLLLAFIAPMLVLLWTSLFRSRQMPSREALATVTVENYQRFLPALGGLKPLLNTLALMAAVAAVVILVSFMVSWLVIRSQIRWRKAIDVVALLPHAIPAIAIAFDLYLVALSVSRWLALGGTLVIIGFAHALSSLAPSTRITNAGLLQIHPELDEAARICRVRENTVLGRVVAPLIKSSLLYGALWTALLSAREVTMALFLVGPNNMVLSVAIWQLWREGAEGLAAPGAILLVAIVGLVCLFTMGISRRLGGQLAAANL